MSKRNPEYDFSWCPGCGDFGVRRSIEMAVQRRMTELELPMENNVIVAGIGCSGNMVHLLEGPQPFGFHGVHGRTLPIALGVKMANPSLNVVVVAGDGDFLSIGAEHIGPAASRNLNVTCVIMDNGVYGLTKGQASPTTKLGTVTPTTPWGKIEQPVNPVELFLTYGVSFIGSGYSSRVKDLTGLIVEAMDHPGFSIVHVQSPCTTYNDTHDALKGDPKKGIAPAAYDIPKSHDPTNKDAALALARAPGTPIGVMYRDPKSVPFEKRLAQATAKAQVRSIKDLIETFNI
ncbi:MAG: 2-oxoacid:ferredoxin oxidoreductase subunit beta [Dehalococcoidia bacterium]|nr:2-oxoacid:ferredoxin oxidoreductase subunit beta [Dehalococcoidia bacterium]